MSLCAAVKKDEIKNLETLAWPTCFTQGQAIYMQGGPNRCVYNVTAGVVRLDSQLSDGRRQVVGFALPGDFLGISMTEKNAFSATALGDVMVCRFPREAFSNFIHERPALLRRIYEMTGQELNLAQEQMTVLGRRTAEERVAYFLVTFRKRWEAINGPALTLPLPMTRQDIGDYLGLTLETASRQISKLARDKIIRVVSGGIQVINENRLVSLTEQ